MSRGKDELRDRAWGAIVSTAFFSFESAVIIALALVLFGLGFAPFDAWQSWYWLVFGVVAEAAYMIATVTDPNASAKAVDHMLSDRFDPGDIRSLVTRERVKRALEYRRLIGEIAQKRGGVMRVGLQQTTDEVTEWIEQIYLLAHRMDTFEENAIINRDRRMAPQELATLRRRLQIEKDPGVRAELEEAIQTKEAQIANLRSLENSIKRADIQLDHTLSALGTVYAQVQLIDTKDTDSARAQRLQQAIKDEVLSLQDTISAIDEVQSYTAAGHS